MDRLRLVVSFLVVTLTAALALSCGAGTGQTQLQSMSVSPMTADAMDYPGGEVPFVTTGYYINPTHTVTPQSATWVACQNEAPVSDVSVSTSGVARCGAGASGVYLIDAWNPVGPGVYSCPVENACVSQCAIEATAQLTCP